MFVAHTFYLVFISALAVGFASAEKPMLPVLTNKCIVTKYPASPYLHVSSGTTSSVGNDDNVREIPPSPHFERGKTAQPIILPLIRRNSVLSPEKGTGGILGSLSYKTTTDRDIFLSVYQEGRKLPSPGVNSRERGIEISRIATDVRRNLIEEGFENVSIILEDRRLTVTYENRVYRHEMRAVREVMAALLPLVKEAVSVTVIPQSRGVPVFCVTIPGSEYLADAWKNPPNPLYKGEEDGCVRMGEGSWGEVDSVWQLAGVVLNGASSDGRPASGIDVSFDVGSAWREVQNPHGTGFWSHRFGVLLHPQFSAEYGDDTELVIYDFNLVPEVNASLWKGMLLAAQLVIPVHNELGEGGDYLRPGLLTLNQVFRLPYSTFASATLGYFTRRRYGADLEVRKYFSNGRWSLGADVGYTGYAAYIDGVWFYSRVGLLTGLFDVEYRLPLFDLGLRATVGRFLYRDVGFRVDFFRQCDEVRIGFFGLKTEGGKNAGFVLRIPIFPSKHLSIGSLRIGTGKEFRQEYRYKGYANEGIYYDTGNSVDGFMKR